MKVTVPWQGPSIDFVFTGQASNDKSRATAFEGFNGETSFIVIKDHFIAALGGTVHISKGAPVNWLRPWPVFYSPQIEDKHVHMDQGGELYNNPNVRALFKEFGYDLLPAGADSSHQNRPVERSHQTIGDALRALLTGANIDPRFWPHAFFSFLRIKNALPGKDDCASYFEHLHDGQKPDLAGSRAFGCRVWAHPPRKRHTRLKNHAQRGIFLGFLPNTTKNILWCPETHCVKIAFHVCFDEGVNDSALADLPPNVRHLHLAQDGAAIPEEATKTVVAPFGLTSKPFLHEVDKTLKVEECDTPPFGFQLCTDAATQRVYVSDVAASAVASRLCSLLCATQPKFVGAFITFIEREFS
jgi:hypothetical protein